MTAVHVDLIQEGYAQHWLFEGQKMMKSDDTDAAAFNFSHRYKNVDTSLLSILDWLCQEKNPCYKELKDISED